MAIMQIFDGIASVMAKDAANGTWTGVGRIVQRMGTGDQGVVRSYYTTVQDFSKNFYKMTAVGGLGDLPAWRGEVKAFDGSSYGAVATGGGRLVSGPRADVLTASNAAAPSAGTETIYEIRMGGEAGTLCGVLVRSLDDAVLHERWIHGPGLTWGGNSPWYLEKVTSFPSATSFWPNANATGSLLVESLALVY